MSSSGSYVKNSKVRISIPTLGDKEQIIQSTVCIFTKQTIGASVGGLLKEIPRIFGLSTTREKNKTLPVPASYQRPGKNRLGHLFSLREKGRSR